MMERSVGALILAALVACVCLCHVLVLANLSTENSDELILEWERISVSIVDGPTFSLMVAPNDTVENLIQDIFELEGVPLYLISPTINNTRIDLRAKLYEYIRAGTTLTLIIPEDRSRNTTEFVVRTRDGRELPVASPLNITVASLKENIAQWVGISRAEQRLLLRGKELKDDRKLVNYHFYNGTLLKLGKPLEECEQVVTLCVNTLSGATIQVEVNLADSVNDLKEKIWEEAGVPVGVQQLSASAGAIFGEDRLCDLGVEAGSTVEMFFRSSRIASLDQVARLKEPPVACRTNPHRAPIFREVEDPAKCARGGRPPASLFKDARNWVAQVGSYRPECHPSRFDPVAHLKHNPDDEEWLVQLRKSLATASRPDASESNRLDAQIVRAEFELSSAVRPYRVAANLTTLKGPFRQFPGITLGGGSTQVNPKQVVSLGADINNWAPDAFSDSDLMRLFEVSERVRQVLTMAAQTGEGILSIDGQRRINRAILFAYLTALAGYPPAVEYDQSTGGNGCGICMDDLTAEPAVKLACKHAFHVDCAHSWVSSLYQEGRIPSCPLCRQKFRLPYEAFGEIELKTTELRDNRGD